MADLPRQRLPGSGKRRVAGSVGRINEEKEPKWEEARSSVSSSESEAESEYIPEDSDLSMTSEELDEDDLLDDEDEYQKEIAMQRREDEKNGHFLEAEPSLLGLPASGKVEDDGSLHSLSEIEEMKKVFLSRMVPPHPVYNVESSSAKLSSQPPASDSAKVAAFEAHFTPGPSESKLRSVVEEGGKLQGSFLIMGKKENKGCMVGNPPSSSWGRDSSASERKGSHFFDGVFHHATWKPGW